MSFISLIPARKNSRRLKNKNLKKINGKPLFFFSIKASINSKYIRKTYFFSDCIKMNKIARKYNALTDCYRPANVSGSKISMNETVFYFVRKMKLKNSKYKYLVLLQPTSPQRTSKDLSKACELILKNKKADSLVSSYKLNDVDANRLMFANGKYLTLNKNKKWTKNTVTYHRNGPSIIITKIKNITKNNLYEKGMILNFPMPKSKSIDIDNKNDFMLAKKKLK